MLAYTPTPLQKARQARVLKAHCTVPGSDTDDFVGDVENRSTLGYLVFGTALLAAWMSKEFSSALEELTDAPVACCRAWSR
jgi:hypothetical protein